MALPLAAMMSHVLTVEVRSVWKLNFAWTVGAAFDVSCTSHIINHCPLKGLLAKHLTSWKQPYLETTFFLFGIVVFKQAIINISYWAVVCC